MLARAGGLSSSEAALLWRAARHMGLENPALIFVRRSVFEGAVRESAVDPAQADSVRCKIYGP